MRWWGLFILLSFNFFSVPSLALQESEQPFVYDLLEEGEFYQVGTFKGQGDIPLYYAKFGRGQGEKGSLVFINGLAENLFKYLELFYDLYLQGYSPIYTYDHRGQGLSNRFLSDPKAGYVEYFSHYSKDLRIFLHNVVPKDSEVDQDNLFAIAHSMGGTVLVDYLQTPSPDVKRRISRSGVVMLGNPEYPKEFKAIVLSSPLFYPQHDDSEYPDWVVLNVFRFQKCASSFFSFDSCLKYDLITSSRSKLTNSRARYKFFSRTREFVQEAFDMPDPWVIPTYDWIIKMFEATMQLRQKERIQQITTPLLILQSEKEKLVSNEHQNQFCQVIPDFCRIQKIPGKHEHFMEIDDIRDQAIEETLNFFIEVNSQ